jgi:hypothetical protein
MENMQTYKLTYTGAVIQEKLDKIDTLAENYDNAIGLANVADDKADEALAAIDTFTNKITELEGTIDGITVPQILHGTNEPDNSEGKNGDLYIVIAN